MPILDLPASFEKDFHVIQFCPKFELIDKFVEEGKSGNGIKDLAEYEIVDFHE
jgi:hypothetical protein